MKTINLVAINFKRNELKFYKSFIDSLGGVKKAKQHLINIIDRYFNAEYIDPVLEEELEHE